MNSVWSGTITPCLLLCLMLTGCGASIGPLAKSKSWTQPALPTALETAESSASSPPAEGDSQTVAGATGSRVKTATLLPGIVDHTGGEYPPGLLSEAMDTLEGRPRDVLLFRSRSSSMRQFLVITDQGDRGVFIEKDGGYIRLNSGAELTGINLVLRGFRFTRQDFDRPSAVCKFLMAVMFCYEGSIRAPCTTFAVDGLVRDPSEWLKGTKQTEAQLRELCRDPAFLFEGDRWSITFSAFRPDGGVDKWRFVGRHDPASNVNRILRIDVSDAQPPGTFRYPLYDYD
jgi:hypothetical protein